MHTIKSIPLNLNDERSCCRDCSFSILKSLIRKNDLLPHPPWCVPPWNILGQNKNRLPPAFSAHLLMVAASVYLIMLGIQLYTIEMLHIIVQEIFGLHLWRIDLAHPARQPHWGQSTYTAGWVARAPPGIFALPAGSAGNLKLMVLNSVSGTFTNFITQFNFSTSKLFPQF